MVTIKSTKTVQERGVAAGVRKSIVLSMHRHGFLLFLTILVLILSSCKEVTFPEPQPKGVASLTEIPATIRGNYVPSEPTEDKKDTLIIESWGYHFRDSKDKDWLGRGVLSDSLVVKYYQDYYFVNFRADNRWVLRLIRRKSSGALDFLSLNVQDEQKEIELIRNLSKSVEVKKVELNGDTFYEINPTRDQLMAFIKQGLFSGSVLEKK
jgi:hypothetical protein